MKRSLLENIKDYSQSSIYPLHMPGHKRNMEKFPFLPFFSWDMTESYGMVDLFAKEGLLQEKQEQVAKSHHSYKSYFGINGSSGHLLAAIFAATKKKDPVLVQRNCHRAIYHGLELQELEPIFFLPEENKEFGLYDSVSPQKIEKLLEEYPKTKCVLICSPSFEGILSDIKTIAEICHKKDCLLLVDQAHGAHFHYSKDFDSAISLGADLVIESLHKTLPALTSTSLLHISQRIDPKKVEHYLRVFQTSSPSHILLASIDECLIYMEEKGRQEMEKHYIKLQAFYKKIQGLEKLQVFQRKDWFDPSKILISTSQTPIVGKDLAKILREDYAFELEMAYGDYCLALTSLADRKDALLAFANALLEMDQKLEKTQEKKMTIFPSLAKRNFSIREAQEKEGRLVHFQDSLGKTILEYLWAYPPGVPLLIPGERIEASSLARIQELQDKKIGLETDHGSFPKLFIEK